MAGLRRDGAAAAFARRHAQLVAAKADHFNVQVVVHEFYFFAELHELIVPAQQLAENLGKLDDQFARAVGIKAHQLLNYQLPISAHLPRLLADGWQLNTIVTVQSGRPIGVYTGGGPDFHQRPDIVPGVNPILPTWTPATGYLNPAAFQVPAGDFGNLGRNQIYGPGFWNADFSVSKITKLKETLALQFRAEIFNIFNHPNFALPTNQITPGINADGTVNSDAGPAGLITQTPDVAQGNPGLGGGGPRVLQFGLRLQF